jgi:alpha-amylase
MPFQAVDRTIEFLRRLQRETPVAITFADDAEKFGLWPKTYRWVYEEGWLDQFFSALERERTWLATATFQDYAASAAPDGIVALPCGSYEEMLEWSGGSFRNFFTKYPEANAMQQKMLRISETLQSFPVNRPPRHTSRAGRGVPQAVQRARQALYQAQCNCAYWHGVFGGLYLAHLRRTVYAKLIEAEQFVDRARPARTGRGRRGVSGSRVTVADVDADGRAELCLKTATMGLVVDPAEGGTLTEWSLYGPKINLLDTLTRRPEPYHEKLRMRQAQPAPSPGQGVASIHDLLGVKEEHLESHLVYDDHRRLAFLDYALQSLPGLHEVTRSAWGERRLWSVGPFQVARVLEGKQAAGHVGVVMARAMPHGRLQKTVRVALSRPVLECRYDVEDLSIPVVALEFNWALRDEQRLTPRQSSDVTRLEVVDSSAGLALRATLEPAATVIHFPVETVSESEAGMERTYQGLCVMCLWPLADAGGRWSSRVTWTVA